MMKKSAPALGLAVLCILQTLAAVAAPAPMYPPFEADYHTYAEMVGEINALQAAHPDLVAVQSIGKTYEGRDIWAVKLSDDVATNDSAEPDVLIFGGIHAREIMGPEVVLYVLNYMLDGYGINETISQDINTKESWFIPMINPDGHVYVEGGNDWRGNRRPTTGGNIGVDLNRNWGYMFGVDGATSNDPADQTYHGPYPFSECETVALSNLALRQRFATSLSYHSVASLVLYPWGFTATHAPDHDELDAMAQKIASWNGYTPEQSSDLYFTHGDSEDWFYANTSTLAFTIELDTAFYPPSNQIPISCGLNREPTLYLIGYPNASIIDAGVFGLPAPFNNTLVEPDREMNVSALVMNYGSSDTDIPVEVEITSGDYLFTNSSSIRLRPGQTGLCNFSWLPPLTAGENCTVTVWTNLTGDGDTWNDRKDARFRIKPKYGAALDPPAETDQSCYPGESVRYGMLLRSLSNRDDDILFETTGSKTGWASLPAKVHLPPAGREEIELSVAVPANAVPGEIARISVRAFSSTGQGAAGLVDTATRVLDPAPTAVAGEDVTVNVTREIIFDGSRSTTPTGTLVNYSWDFGDGAFAEGVSVRHAYMKRGDYVVNLTVTNALGYSRTASLNVTVLQEFKVALSADTASVRLSPGETVDVNLTLENAGNGPDNIVLTLDALKWNASIDSENASLPAGESMAFRLLVTAPSDSVAGTTAMFRVTAQSLESPYANDEVVLTATVREVHDFTLSILNATRSLDPGQSTRVTALLTNAGNIAETVNLTATDVPDALVVDIWAQNITLAPWTDNFVIIAVYAPAWALAGDYSFSVNGIELDITVNARFRLDAAVGNASVTIRPGEVAVFNVTVANQGNAPDSFSITLGELPESWGATIGQLGILAAGANGTVTITIALPKNATAGTYDLRLSVRSAGDANQTRVLPVQVTVLKKATPPAATSEAFPILPLLLIIIIIAVVVVVIIIAMRRKRPPADAPQEAMPAEAPPPDGGGQY